MPEHDNSNSSTKILRLKDLLDIESGGVMELSGGALLNVESGGEIAVKDGGSIDFEAGGLKIAGVEVTASAEDLNNSGGGGGGAGIQAANATYTGDPSNIIYTADFDPAPESYDDLPIVIIYPDVGNDSGNVSINFNSLGVKNVCSIDSSAPKATDIPGSGLPTILIRVPGFSGIYAIANPSSGSALQYYSVKGYINRWHEDASSVDGMYVATMDQSNLNDGYLDLGQVFHLLVTNTNTTTTNTFDIINPLTGMPAGNNVPIKLTDGSDIAVGALLAGTYAMLIYNSSNYMQLINPAAVS